MLLVASGFQFHAVVSIFKKMSSKRTLLLMVIAFRWISGIIQICEQSIANFSAPPPPFLTILLHKSLVE